MQQYDFAVKHQMGYVPLPERAIVNSDSYSLLHAVASTIFDTPQKFCMEYTGDFWLQDCGYTDRIGAQKTSSWEMSVFSGTGVRCDMSRTERKIRMQHDYIQQKEQRCALQEDKQQFIEEIAALRSLAKLAGLTGHLFEDLDDFKHDIERLDASSWERKQVQVLNRNTLERFSLAVLRAYRMQSS